MSSTVLSEPSLCIVLLAAFKLLEVFGDVWDEKRNPFLSPPKSDDFSAAGAAAWVFFDSLDTAKVSVEIYTIQNENPR